MRISALTQGHGQPLRINPVPRVACASEYDQGRIVLFCINDRSLHETIKICCAPDSVRRSEPFNRNCRGDQANAEGSNGGQFRALEGKFQPMRQKQSQSGKCKQAPMHRDRFLSARQIGTIPTRLSGEANALPSRLLGDQESGSAAFSAMARIMKSGIEPRSVMTQSMGMSCGSAGTCSTS